MKITLVKGDITEQRVDAVVNAANSSLLGGGGVDGAIHRRGGPEILAECRRLRASHYGEGLPTGEAVATTAGDLPARWVIHTVGPVFSSSEDRSELLASCYRESLRVAGGLGATSVAFPAISAGIYAWPMDDAARIAIATVRTTSSQVGDVRFVLFTSEAYAAFEQALSVEEPTGGENLLPDSGNFPGPTDGQNFEGPTDSEIASTLAAQPAERWARLFELVDGLTPADLQVRWGGGQKLDDGAFQVPFPIYSAAINTIIHLLYELKVMVAFAWPEWHRTTPLFPDGRGLADAPVADAARLATTFVRGERFSDGAIQQAIESGALQAILDRLRRWFDHEYPAR
jgi:O-acetyl-ADP-ribose deacetylase (regulator of RNase III)